MQRRTFSENTFLGVSNSVEELKEFTITELTNERIESEQEIDALNTELRSFTTDKFNESKTYSDQKDVVQSSQLTQIINDENAAQSAQLLGLMDVKDEVVKTFAKARANHTGTQLSSTISDFSTRVTQEFADGNLPRIIIDSDSNGLNRAKLSCHRTGGMTFDINQNVSFRLHQSLYSDLFHEITTERLRFITISAGQSLSFMSETGGLIMRLEDFQGGDAGSGGSGENGSLIEVFTAIDMNNFKISNIGDLNTSGVSYTSPSAFNDYYNGLDPLGKQSAILPQSEVQSLIDTSSTADRSRTNHTGTQLASTISDFQASVGLNPDLVDATSKKHTHTNKTILDATQESFTSALKTKLDSAAIIDDLGASGTTTFSSNKINSNINVNVTNARNFAIQRVNHTGTQLANTISDFQANVGLNPDLVDATTKKHTHTNKAILDLIEEPFTTIQKNKLDTVITTSDLTANSTADRSRTNHTGTQLADTISDFQTTVSLNTDLADATLKKHTHTNKTILDNITFALTAQDKLKIDNATMIYDAGAYADSTYSSQKIESLLSAKIDSTLVYLKTEIDNLLALKQNLLTSGTNIKTINGNSILGSGDITISAGSSNTLEQFDYGQVLLPSYTTLTSTGPPLDILNFNTTAQNFGYGRNLVYYHFKAVNTCDANFLHMNLSARGNVTHTFYGALYATYITGNRNINYVLLAHYTLLYADSATLGNKYLEATVASGQTTRIDAGMNYFFGLYSPDTVSGTGTHAFKSTTGVTGNGGILRHKYVYPLFNELSATTSTPPTGLGGLNLDQNPINKSIPYFRFYNINPSTLP